MHVGYVYVFDLYIGLLNCTRRLYDKTSLLSDVFWYQIFFSWWWLQFYDSSDPCLIFHSFSVLQKRPHIWPEHFMEIIVIDFALYLSQTKIIRRSGNKIQNIFHLLWKTVTLSCEGLIIILNQPGCMNASYVPGSVLGIPGRAVNVCQQTTYRRENRKWMTIIQYWATDERKNRKWITVI